MPLAQPRQRQRHLSMALCTTRAAPPPSVCFTSQALPVCVFSPPSKPFTRAALSARCRLSRCRGLGLCPCRQVPVYYCVAVRSFTQSNPSSSTM
jgi:hypothetical protein